MGTTVALESQATICEIGSCAFAGCFRVTHCPLSDYGRLCILLLCQIAIFDTSTATSHLTNSSGFPFKVCHFLKSLLSLVRIAQFVILFPFVMERYCVALVHRRSRFFPGFAGFETMHFNISIPLKIWILSLGDGVVQVGIPESYRRSLFHKFTARWHLEWIHNDAFEFAPLMTIIHPHRASLHLKDRPSLGHWRPPLFSSFAHMAEHVIF
jgi:hypothetical protein